MSQELSIHTSLKRCYLDCNWNKISFERGFIFDMLCACYVCGFCVCYMYFLCGIYSIICVCYVCVVTMYFACVVWSLSICVGYVCVTCICVVCVWSVLREFYLYFVCVVCCVCRSYLCQPVCTRGAGSNRDCRAQEKEKMLTLWPHIKHLSCIYIHGDCK